MHFTGLPIALDNRSVQASAEAEIETTLLDVVVKTITRLTNANTGDKKEMIVKFSAEYPATTNITGL